MNYDISKHRFKELKHYCLQYPEWKAMCDILDGPWPSNGHNDPVSKIAILRADYSKAMELIEMTALATSEKYASYILKSVTEDIPLSKIGLDTVVLDAYRRKFFWLLSQRKGV